MILHLVLQAEEEIYHSQLVTIHALMTHMSNKDTEMGDTGVLSRDDFQKSLTEYFPAMTEDMLPKVMKCVDIELEGIEVAEIDYKSLFTEVIPLFFTTSICLLR